MMRGILLTPMLVLLVLALGACGSDDDESPTGLPPDGDLQAMAECAAEGIKHLGLAIETSLLLFHELDNDPPLTLPFDFHYNKDTGNFDYKLVLGSDPADPTQIKGVVAPLATVEDGLQQHDNFTVTWTMRPQSATEDVAAGSFRVIHNGLTGPPANTETMRLIPAADIWSGSESACLAEFTQLDLTLHHLIEGEEIRTALTSFTCTDAADDTLKGYMTVDPGTNMGSITGTYDGVTYTCSINMETYVIDCSGN
ncbi:MAG: hypothetical protein KAH56_13860 [Candidatus Krumholzibacteria bacterium]|nr:hypothetical protein [Candidatus Krumholzibacteria bacterium]